jgi:hypothetical protein
VGPRTGLDTEDKGKILCPFVAARLIKLGSTYTSLNGETYLLRWLHRFQVLAARFATVSDIPQSGPGPLGGYSEPLLSGG